MNDKKINSIKRFDNLLVGVQRAVTESPRAVLAGGLGLFLTVAAVPALLGNNTNVPILGNNIQTRSNEGFKNFSSNLTELGKSLGLIFGGFTAAYAFLKPHEAAAGAGKLYKKCCGQNGEKVEDKPQTPPPVSPPAIPAWGKCNFIDSVDLSATR
jgi:hypothetical protein